jgi:hypothetical protein
MATVSIQRARQLLGDKTHSLSDAEIQAKIDIMMVLANRCYDLIEAQNQHETSNENTTES